MKETWKIELRLNKNKVNYLGIKKNGRKYNLEVLLRVNLLLFEGSQKFQYLDVTRR